jgi:uncharacterized membrane protein
MSSYLWQYMIALVVFLGIDAVWLSTAGRSVYFNEIGNLLLDKPNFVVAFMFYLIFVAGMVAFVITPAVATGSIAHALVMGAFFGLVAYATYDLTNLATLKGFTVKVAIIDMVWGAVLSASVCGLTTFLVRKLGVG